MSFLYPFSHGVQIGPGGLSRPAKHRRTTSKRRHRSRSPSRSSRGGSSLGDFLGRRGKTEGSHAGAAASSSFFGLGGGEHSRSRSSFFNFGNRSSYYKRSPRQSFLQKAYRRLRRLLRDLADHARRHPWKVLLLVVMPLVTTGVLGGLLARFGLRVPPSLERIVGLASRAAAGDSIGLVTDAVRMAGDLGGVGGTGDVRRTTVARGHDGGLQWEKRSTYGSYSGSSDHAYGHGSHGFGFDGDGDGDGWGSALSDFAKKWL